MLAEDRQRAEARRAARTALESRFIKLPQDYVDHYRSVLAKRPFSRPINPAIAKMTEGEHTNGRAPATYYSFDIYIY